MISSRWGGSCAFILSCICECVLCTEPEQFDKEPLRATYQFKSVRPPPMGSSSFFSHDIFPLSCMVCCRGNRPKSAVAFPAPPGESIHTDMWLTTTCCMTGAGIPTPQKCQAGEQQQLGAKIVYQDHITELQPFARWQIQQNVMTWRRKAENRSWDGKCPRVC